MRTLGIDLAAQPRRTAACVVRWPEDGSGEVRVSPPALGLSDQALLRLMAEADATGIDAPFGWPDFINRYLGAYAREGTWPLRPDAEDPADWASRLLYRETDRAVRRMLLARDPPVRITALSVSSDRIAVCAWRCAALLTRHAQRPGGVFDRTGERSRVYEVYPAAALASWGLRFKGYKAGRGGGAATGARERRAEIADALQARCPWLHFGRDPALRAAFVDSDDKLDAFVAAIVARAAATGDTALPATDDERALARSEGWIHVPEAGSLERLGAGRP